LESHPFKALFDAGVKTTINTDDPGIMCTNLLNEYELLAAKCGIDFVCFEACNEWALDVSFIPAQKKKSTWNKRFES
jgi:adenosine deaminase